jgi:poly(A) polymerase
MFGRPKTVICSRSQHTLSRKHIDEHALKVMYRLQDHGHRAYLVGGGVRDLLLGQQPKDFDVSTDARPQQIKRMFKNCFLVGKRFRLAHIRFGYHKVIETSTFRSLPKQDLDANDPDADLFRHDDNEFGSPEEDAQRRDFTVNGLFYDLKDFSIIDHVGGLSDLKRGFIRSIGDANVRFREDPVRMLRAVRFAARLGFRIEARTRRALIRHHAEIEKASKPRMLEDIYKLFAFHVAEATFRLLRDVKLMESMFPELDGYLSKASREDTDAFWRTLAALDSGEYWHEKPSTILMFSALLCTPILARLDAVRESGEAVDSRAFVGDMLAPISERFCFPKRLRYGVIDVIAGQERLVELSEHQKLGRKSPRHRFLVYENFPEVFAVYQMRASAGLCDPTITDGWVELAKHDEVRLGHAVPQPPREARPRRRPRRRKDQPEPKVGGDEA